MDEITFKLILTKFDDFKNLFEEKEKLALERHERLREDLDEIKTQQIESKRERKEIVISVSELRMNYYKEELIADEIEKLKQLVDSNKKEYEKDSFTSRFFTKNPQAFISYIAVSVVGILLTIFSLFKIVNDKILETEKQINVIKVQRVFTPEDQKLEAPKNYEEATHIKDLPHTTK